MSVTVPSPISTLRKVEIGDTVEFIDKFNTFQSELTRFSGEANHMASALNSLINDFTTLTDQSEQSINTLTNDFSNFVDQSEQSIDTQANNHKTDMSTYLNRCQQSHTDVVQVLNQVNHISDQINLMFDQVIEAQKSALIVASNNLPDVAVARLEKEVRKIKAARLGINI